MTLFKTNYT